jgi:hypothetical protein
MIIFENLGLKRLESTFFKDFLVKFLHEIQYLTAYIFGNIHPRQNIKIVSNRSYLKFLFFK